MRKKVHFGPQIGIQRLTTCEKKYFFMRGGASFVFFLSILWNFAIVFLSFITNLQKNSQQILVECAQNHFKSALGKLLKFAKKFLSNNRMKNLGKMTEKVS